MGLITDHLLLLSEAKGRENTALQEATDATKLSAVCCKSLAADYWRIAERSRGSATVRQPVKSAVVSASGRG